MKDWTTIKLGSLLTESKIESTDPDTKKRIRVKLNVGGVEQRPDTNDKEGATKYYVRKTGQFIYGKQNLHKGAFGIVPNELNEFESSSDIPAFDVHESCYPEWIFYFFKQGNFYLKLESLAKGVGSKRIHAKQLFELNIYLPGKVEQKRILDSVKIFEQGVSEMNTEIERQFQLLIQLKKKTIQESIQGKLTSQWRNQNSNHGSAVELLKRIRLEKKELIKQKKIPKEIPLLEVKSNEAPFNVPSEWVWCRFENVLQSLRYGTSKKCDYNLGETSVLRIPNIVEGKIDLTDLKSTNLTPKEKTDLSIRENDLLLIRSNGSTSLVGRSAAVDSNSIGYSFAGYLMRARPFSEISSEYIHIVLESPFIREIIEGSIRTTSGVKNINSTEVYRLLIPLPSYPEQIAIVKKVERLFNIYIEMKKKIEHSKNDVELLVQKTLSEIFDNKSNELIGDGKPKKKETTSMLPLRLMNSYTLNQNMSVMELEELLKKNGKMSAISLWQMSKFENDIDAFYEELKELVEKKKTIKESVEKGFLELVK